jgi:hypothetical protein
MSCPEAEGESLTEKFVAAQMNPENQNELFQGFSFVAFIKYVIFYI